jgi:hypothetical protein
VIHIHGVSLSPKPQALFCHAVNVQRDLEPKGPMMRFPNRTSRKCL